MLKPDLAPITRHLRAKASSHLLVSAVHHLNIFEILSSGPLLLREIREKTNLGERPAMVLFPALAAMDLIHWASDGKIELTATGKYLTKGKKPNLIGYVGLEKDDAGVLQMTEFLLNDGPGNREAGFSYVKDDESESPMDDDELSRFFTNALAGRAEFLSPVVAENLPRIEGHLLDVAGGTGFYSFEWLLLNQQSTATVFDRPAVLKVSQEYLQEFVKSGRKGAETIKERITFLPGDMLNDALPSADIVLAASLFHDWPSDTCTMLARKFAAAINPGGSLWVHDSFINNSLDGPIAVTDYSAILFLGTKGRAYSRKEHRTWFSDSGLINNEENIPTLMDYGLIWAAKK